MEKANNKAVNLSIKLDVSDYKNFNLQHIKKEMTNRLAFYSVLFVLIVFGLTARSQPGSSAVSTTTAIAIPVGIATMALIVFTYRLNAGFKAKKIFENDKTARKQQNFILSAEGIAVKTDTSSGTIKWSEVYRVNETRALFALYIAKNKAFILPKRYFSDEGQIRLLKEILRSNVAPVKLKLLW